MGITRLGISETLRERELLACSLHVLRAATREGKNGDFLSLSFPLSPLASNSVVMLSAGKNARQGSCEKGAKEREIANKKKKK